MAYDKVVDSSALDAGLVRIADAIREKGGVSDKLAFPDAMAAAIVAIETGGGLPSGLSAVATGTFTLSSNAYVKSIEHGLGVVPNFVAVWVEGDFDTSNNKSALIASFGYKGNITIDSTDNDSFFIDCSTNASGAILGVGTGCPSPQTAAFFTKATVVVGGAGTMKSGLTYRWITGLIE